MMNEKEVHMTGFAKLLCCTAKTELEAEGHDSLKSFFDSLSMNDGIGICSEFSARFYL